MAQTIKNPPAMQEAQFYPQGQKDALEKVMTTHSSILAWIVPWTEEPGRSPWGSQRIEHDWAGTAPGTE